MSWLLVLFGMLVPSAVEWNALPEALQTSVSEQRPTVVYVQAVWCGPCRRLERETFADGRVQQRLAQFATAKLTFDDHDTIHRVGPYRLSEAGWAKQFGATATPALILLDAQGAVLARHIGLIPVDRLVSLLDTVLQTTASATESERRPRP